jgi:hypothetical protein
LCDGFVTQQAIDPPLLAGRLATAGTGVEVGREAGRFVLRKIALQIGVQIMAIVHHH